MPYRLASWIVGGRMPPMRVRVSRICSFSSSSLPYVISNETTLSVDKSDRSIPYRKKCFYRAYVLYQRPWKITYYIITATRWSFGDESYRKVSSSSSVLLFTCQELRLTSKLSERKTRTIAIFVVYLAGNRKTDPLFVAAIRTHRCVSDQSFL